MGNKAGIRHYSNTSDFCKDPCLLKILPILFFVLKVTPTLSLFKKFCDVINFFSDICKETLKNHTIQMCGRMELRVSHTRPLVHNLFEHGALFLN